MGWYTMILSNTVALTVSMGVLLVAVVVVYTQLRTSQSNRATPPPQSATAEEDIPPSWILGFLLLVAVAGGGTLAFLASDSIGQFAGQTAGILIAVVLGGILGGYLISGIYVSLRSHGRKSAEATGVALWLLGCIAIAVIAGQLVLVG